MTVRLLAVMPFQSPPNSISWLRMDMSLILETLMLGKLAKETGPTIELPSRSSFVSFINDKTSGEGASYI